MSEADLQKRRGDTVSESGKNDPNSPGGNGSLTRRGHGGPSTPEGKAKTKFNAPAHGVFSGAVVLIRMRVPAVRHLP